MTFSMPSEQSSCVGRPSQANAHSLDDWGNRIESARAVREQNHTTQLDERIDPTSQEKTSTSLHPTRRSVT